MHSKILFAFLVLLSVSCAKPGAEHALRWFEIPVTDFDRATQFYSKVLNIKITAQDIAGARMGMFPGDNNSVSGALVKGDGYVPSGDGTLVYLNAGRDLSAALARVESAGGKILVPKTHISDEVGYFAMFLDTEGNRVAFLSPE